MRRLILAGLIVTVGCQGVVGPGQRLFLSDPIDDPCLTAEEQKRRARDRLALPEAGFGYGPRTYSDNPALKGP